MMDVPTSGLLKACVLFVVALSGCVTNSTIDPNKADRWIVARGEDPMNDTKICRLTAKPDSSAVFSFGANLFHISPFVERYGNQVRAGFRAGFPGTDLAPAGAMFSSIEYRFDKMTSANIGNIVPSKAILLSDADARRFITHLRTATKILYRVDGKSLVEFPLGNSKSALAACEIDEVAEISNSNKVFLGITVHEMPSGHFDMAKISEMIAQYSNLKTPEDWQKLNSGNLGQALNTSSVMIATVTVGGPAEMAGIIAGDIILKISDTSINSKADITDILSKSLPGETLKITMMRSGVQQIVPVTLGRADLRS